MTRIRVRRFTILGFAVAIIAVALSGWYFRTHEDRSIDQVEAANHASVPSATKSTRVKVDVVKPHQGGLDRISVQPGSIHAYEAAELYAKVSGYLAKLHVDIGDKVKAGQVLVELDSPELHRDVDRGKAAVDRALAQVGQMKARVTAAEADKHAAETGIARAKAGVNRDVAAFEFRDKQFRRFKELVSTKSIDERLVDEKEDQRLGAESAVDASRAGLAEAEALVASAVAKVEQAKADQLDAEAEVEVANATLARARVLAEYTTVTAPYDGVVTFRGFHRGDFIRSADQGPIHPLLRVERVDVVRLVVAIPDVDVPFTDPGDETETEIEALAGQKFVGKISRIAFSEDAKTRTMRTEVDLPNEKGLLRNGMYGRTKLKLQAGNPAAVRVPSSALSGGTKDGKGTVFVARDNAAKKTPVTVTGDNGVYAEITTGITAGDLVIVGNNNSIIDGTPVEIHELPNDLTKK